MNDMNPRRHKTQLLLASANKKSAAAAWHTTPRISSLALSSCDGGLCISVIDVLWIPSEARTNSARYFCHSRAHVEPNGSVSWLQPTKATIVGKGFSFSPVFLVSINRLDGHGQHYRDGNGLHHQLRKKWARTMVMSVEKEARGNT